jgi:alpha-tubulin suppressor-like RCC1 family protein
MYAVARRIEEWGWPVDLRLRPPQIQTGVGRTCVLSARGLTRCIGFDDRYESGPIEIDIRLDQLSVRDDHACGIAAGGRAFCTGLNGNGQLGDGSTESRHGAPAEVAGGLVFESISAGAGHTCGVVSGGDVQCWGLAEGGALGALFDEDRTTPIRVPLNARFRSVSAMWQYTCALTAAGEAWCWGDVAGTYTYGAAPARFAPDLSFAALTAGWYQVCAITQAGKAWCWGFNDRGQLGTGTPDDEFHEEPSPVSGDHAFTDISSGVGHVCGVTVAGEIWCWGSNDFGQLGNGTTDGSAVPIRVSGGHVFEAVSAGDLHTCGLTLSSEVWCWGNNALVGSHEGGGVLPGGDERYTEPVRTTLSLDPDERRPWRR